MELVSDLRRPQTAGGAPVLPGTPCAHSPAHSPAAGLARQGPRIPS